jgi:hypothetical protein
MALRCRRVGAVHSIIRVIPALRRVLPACPDKRTISKQDRTSCLRPQPTRTRRQSSTNAVSLVPSSSRRWPARSRPANLPGRNGAPRSSPRSALGSCGPSREPGRGRGFRRARPSGRAWAHCSLPASQRRRSRSQSRRRARPRSGSAGATSASAVGPRRARRTAVGTPPSPRRRAGAGWPPAGSSR